VETKKKVKSKNSLCDSENIRWAISIHLKSISSNRGEAAIKALVQTHAKESD